MNGNTTEEKFAILFVDDEAMALKYFTLAFGKEFRVLTAENVAQALEILEREADAIGVLVTDQRMPGPQGVDLLKQARSRWPAITRILTTAHTDLEDAIEAVNSGEILRYITKPWDLNSLRADLRNALDFFLLRRERDLLMGEKYSVRRRLVQSDRLRDLLIIAGGLQRLRHVEQAVSRYLGDLLTDQADASAGASELELWGLDMEETRRLRELNRAVQTLDRSVDGDFTRNVDLAGPLKAAGLRVDGRASLSAEPELLKMLALSLSDRLSDAKATLTSSESGVEAVISGSPARSPGAGELGWFAAYLIAAHHGGFLQVRVEQGSIRADLKLPVDPASVQWPPAGDQWLEEQFALLEDW